MLWVPWLYPEWKLTKSQLQHKLRHLILHLQNRLDNLTPMSSSTLQIDHFTNSPIFSLKSRAPRELANACQSRGLTVRPIMPPTVPEGKERVRICLHAGNTMTDINRLVETIRLWLAQEAKIAARL